MDAPPVSPTVVITQERKKSHIFAWIVIILILGVGAFLIYYYWDQILPPIKKLFSKNGQEETPTPEVTPIPSDRKGSLLGVSATMAPTTMAPTTMAPTMPGATAATSKSIILPKDKERSICYDFPEEIKI